MTTTVLLLPLLVAQAIGFVFGIIIIVGAVKMMRLQSHGFATVAGVLALLPCGPTWLLGLPMGIWSLLVLGRPDVKAAFRAKQPKAAPAAPEAGKLRLQAPADALILAGSAALLTALGVGFWLWLKWNEAVLSELDKGSLVGMSVGNAVYALIIIMAGILMRGLRGRLFALVCVVIFGLFFPAVAALNVVMELKNIPQWPVVIPMWLGVPVAVWATVVLFRQDVRAAFQDQGTLRAAARKSQEVLPSQSAWGRLDWRIRMLVVVLIVVAGFVGKKLFFPDISEALGTVLLVLSIAAFLVDVVAHPEKRQGLQALFALLGGLVGLLIYLFFTPMPLQWLYDFTGSEKGMDDVAAAHIIIVLITAWLVYLMIQVWRKMRRHSGLNQTAEAREQATK